jgi:hypothetical protein
MMAALDRIFVNQCLQDCTSGIGKARPTFTVDPQETSSGCAGGIAEV